MNFEMTKTAKVKLRNDFVEYSKFENRKKLKFINRELTEELESFHINFYIFETKTTKIILSMASAQHGLKRFALLAENLINRTFLR